MPVAALSTPHWEESAGAVQASSYLVAAHLLPMHQVPCKRPNEWPPKFQNLLGLNFKEAQPCVEFPVARHEMAQEVNGIVAILFCVPIPYRLSVKAVLSKVARQAHPDMPFSLQAFCIRS